MRSKGMWAAFAAGSRDPSAPVVGPETSETSMSPACFRPWTVVSVFSCAPPTTRRVMTCVTRIRSGCGLVEVLQPLADLGGLDGVGGCVAEVEAEVVDGLVAVVAPEGDLAEAVVDGVSVGELEE